MSTDTLLHLQSRAMACPTLAQLGFTVVNETHALLGYRQAAFFLLGADGKPTLTTASGLVSVAEDAPFTVWLTRFAQSFAKPEGEAQRLNLAQAAPEHAAGWAEWLPEHLLAAPLPDLQGRALGWVLYARESPWADAEVADLTRLHQSYGYCVAALSRRGSTWRAGWARVKSAKFRWGLLAALLLAQFIPVRLSALAPAEVIALNAMAVAAPQDGVIGSVAVAPNAVVKAGDLLFSLDNSALDGRRQVALKALEIARADALLAQQRAFDDIKSRGDLATAQGRVQEKEAELAAVDALVGRVEVRAERDGIAVFGDPNDWLGRPVQTGERVMQIASPDAVGVLVWLPVSDAINLELGARVQLFLHVQPLSPLAGSLLQTSYQATAAPDGTNAYRLRARFDAGVETPRIGLRGTARISGAWTVLGYYVFRRPIAALREWTGL